MDTIHEEMIREHGGGRGVRDAGLIDSALARPRNRWGCEQETDLAVLAAAYGFGLARNHGYVDGNKRVALMAVYVFLSINGHELDASEVDAVDAMERLASGSINEVQFAAWIRQNTHGLRQT